MTLTPRTDALASTPMTRKDSDDFARQLERELAHLSALLAAAWAERETAELRKQALHAIHDELPDGQCRSGAEQVRELKATLSTLRTSLAVAERKFETEREVCDLLRSDVATLRATVAELERDKVRLDWLEKHGNRMYSWVCDWTTNAEVLLRLRQSTAAFPCTPRQAIDAALAQPTEVAGK